MRTNWWFVIIGVVAAAVVVWFLVRHRAWTWPRFELIGYAVWLVAGVMFAVPEIGASIDSDLPFPTLSGTVGHLERRWEIFSLLVIIVVVNALLHGVRLGAAVVANRMNLAQPETTGQVDEKGRMLAPTFAIDPDKHIAVDDGRVTSTSRPRRLGWGFGFAYFGCTVIVLTAAFVIPWGIHGWSATDAEKQLGGEIGYGVMGVVFFVIPALLAWRDLLVPFPGLFTTIGNLEARAKIMAVLVVGCMTFLMLHLVLYPYPSIIPWFPDLKDLHDYCVQHATELVCTSK
jgi:hypothetical protein